MYKLIRNGRSNSAILLLCVKQMFFLAVDCILVKDIVRCIRIKEEIV